MEMFITRHPPIPEDKVNKFRDDLNVCNEEGIYQNYLIDQQTNKI